MPIFTDALLVILAMENNRIRVRQKKRSTSYDEWAYSELFSCYVRAVSIDGLMTRVLSWQLFITCGLHLATHIILTLLFAFSERCGSRKENVKSRYMRQCVNTWTNGSTITFVVCLQSMEKGGFTVRLDLWNRLAELWVCNETSYCHLLAKCVQDICSSRCDRISRHEFVSTDLSQ